ncbi:hypothetical protein APHAL10511_006142 [Amanita phalloides]|nr:hypothetical protein APHAL10511_006142 [Amanita phalloides]
MASLLFHPDLAKADNEATALLDSHFKTVDQAQIDKLLEWARCRHDEHQAKLSESQTEIDKLLLETQATARSHLQSAQELSLVRHSVVDDLTELSQELVSDLPLKEREPTLLEEIETLHRNLKELTSIRSYVQVVEHALSLSESAVKQLQTSSSTISSASVVDYRALQAFVSKIRKLSKACENGSDFQSLHLVVFLETLESKTWTEMKTVLFNDLLASSEKLGWPTAVNYAEIAPEDRASFENAFHNLLKLQSLERTEVAQSRVEKGGLYPIQALVQPISLRFKYHFEGTRQTNRLDKPEWYFTHVQNIAHDHRSYMITVIQGLLSSTEYSGINAWCEFILLLLPLLSRKLRRSMPSLIPHPPLLAHTIYQALMFDAAMREQGFRLEGTSSEEQSEADTNIKSWAGISDVILGNQEWFEAWLAGERKFAEDQYLAIISSPEAWIIVGDTDEEENQDFKPTTSARRLKVLIEQITDRYSPLPDVAQRARFLTTVQLPILDLYHNRVMSSLDAYETLSSAFVRAVPGALSVSFGGGVEPSNVDPRRLTDGVDGVQRLCKAFLSAVFLETALEGWGEELFFLDLWTQMNSDPVLREQIESGPLLSQPIPENNGALTSTVFEELISRYIKVVVRAEDMIVQQICDEVENHLKTHLGTVTSIGSEQTSDINVSQNLLIPITVLSTHLTFIRSVLPQSTLTNLYRRIVARLANHILQRQILYRGQLNLQQGKVITAECELWVETCNVALAGRLSGGRYRVEMPWLRLLQAGRLVSLEGENWLAIRMAVVRDMSEEEWTKIILQIVGISELDKEEVYEVIHRRDDH